MKLSVYFEHLMLDALVGAINNDTSTVGSSSGIKFPRHLSDEVCEYLVTGGGYFDFRGRSGLIKVLKGYIPDDHYLLVAVRRKKYKVTLERLLALRNYAAHESPKGKLAVKEALGVKRIAAAGVWLKTGDRFYEINAKARELAEEIRAGAPY